MLGHNPTAGKDGEQKNSVYNRIKVGKFFILFYFFVCNSSSKRLKFRATKTPKSQLGREHVFNYLAIFNSICKIKLHKILK